MEPTLDASSPKIEAVDRYLAAYRASLKGVPVEMADEFCREAHQHIEALVATAMTGGQSEPQATAQALSRFGDPRVVGAKMRRQWRRRQLLALTGDECLAFRVCVLVIVVPAIISYVRLLQIEHTLPGSTHLNAGPMLMPGFPAFAIAAGLIFPRTAVKAVFWCQLITLLLSALCLAYFHAHHTATFSLLWVLLWGVVQSVFTTACTWLTSILRIRWLEKHAAAPADAV